MLQTRTLVHLVMLTFAGVSVQNIATYFVSAGHLSYAAWTLGAALGLALVTISIMLTHIDQQQDKTALWWLLIAGSVLGLLSGAIQSAEYAKHLEPWAAMALGYGLPLGGEILLSFSTAAYITARKRQKIRMATAGTTERIAECVAEALADVDVSKVKKYVERRIDTIVRAQVDAVAQQLTPVSVTAEMADTNAEDNGPSQFGPSNLPKAQAKRAVQVKQQTAERKEAILTLLAEQGPQGTSTIASALGIHRDTARKLAQSLADTGQIETVGRKWRLTQTSGHPTTLNASQEATE